MTWCYLRNIQKSKDFLVFVDFRRKDPGVGLGVIVSGAKHVTDGMLLAAAEAVASQVNPQDEGASLLPSVNNLRASSATVAVAVAK